MHSNLKPAEVWIRSGARNNNHRNGQGLLTGMIVIMIAREMTAEGEKCPKDYAVHLSWIWGVLRPINSISVFPPVAHSWNRDLM